MDDIESYKKELKLEHYRQKISGLSEEIADLRVQLTIITDAYSTAQKEIGDLREQIRNEEGADARAKEENTPEHTTSVS